MDDFVISAAEIAISSINVISIILITLGILSALYILLIKTWFSAQTDSYAQARLTLSRFLLLALEFQIAADILLTILKPSWEEFGQLAVTIVVRSLLSYILMLEARSNT